jgi:hypothetical protein
MTDQPATETRHAPADDSVLQRITSELQAALPALKEARPLAELERAAAGRPSLS